MKFNRIIANFLVFFVILVLKSAANLPKCGKRPTLFGNVLGGEHTHRNSWMWLVAFREISTKRFFCAGSLISSKHVLSVAHCFEDNRFHKVKNPSEVIAWIGKHNLNNDNEDGSVGHRISEILIHDDWNDKFYDFDADISLIVLQIEVDLLQRKYVRIVCLPPATQNEVSGEGTVVGWGVSERSIADEERHDSTPNEIKLPAVTKDECLKADDDFAQISLDRNFCAGFINKSKSVCRGDAGGGFYQYNRAAKAYELAGMVSASLNGLNGLCRVDTYSIFTSVGKFVDWIERKMEETKGNGWIEVVMDCWGDGIYHACSHNYTGPFRRNIKIRQSHTKSTLVHSLWMHFKPSPYIFAKIGRNFPNLKWLYITRQSIKFIERNNFENMEQLEELFLNDNHIETIDEKTFNDLPSLKGLSLSNNKIKYLLGKIFNNLKNLKWIDIYNNEISTLPRDLFADNLKLKYVYTYNNRGLSTNNVDFSKVPNVELYNETNDKYFKG